MQHGAEQLTMSSPTTAPAGKLHGHSGSIAQYLMLQSVVLVLSVPHRSWQNTPAAFKIVLTLFFLNCTECGTGSQKDWTYVWHHSLIHSRLSRYLMNGKLRHSCLIIILRHHWQVWSCITVIYMSVTSGAEEKHCIMGFLPEILPTWFCCMLGFLKAHIHTFWI